VLANDVVWNGKRLPAEVIQKHFLKPLKRESNINQRAGCLVDAWIENLLGCLLELLFGKDELAVLDINSQELLNGDHLRIEVILDCLRQFENHKAGINLVNVLIQPVVGLQYNQTVVPLLSVQIHLQSGNRLRLDVLGEVVD
jgi:hypothetical protein